jgi:hypothetical protein
MSPARRGEMRCAMLGELIFHEYKRGKTIKTYDLTGEKTEILAGAVAEAIMAEQGISAAWVRALFKQDFEDFTGAMLTDQSSQAVAEKALDDAMAACAPLYASIKVTGDREGSVGALAPLNLPPIAGNEVEAPYCHALFSTFADTMRQKTGRETPESMAFARKAARIRAVLLDKSGRGPEGAATEAMLAAEGAAFDVDAFDALPETDAETIMAACDSFAGPDT